MKHKMLRSAALALLCAFGAAAASAQTAGYTIVSSSLLHDATGTLVTNATIRFQPANAAGAPISFRAGGTGGQAIAYAVSTTVTAGAFSIQLADTSLTSPVNVCYSVTLISNLTGRQIPFPGYSCIQPSGSAWDFDTYTPNLAALVVEQAGPTGPAGPAGPTGATGAAGSGSGATAFSGLTGTALPAQLPAATTSLQGAVQLPSGASSNVLGSAAMTATSAYDGAGVAATAQSTAETFATSAIATSLTAAQTFATSAVSAERAAAANAANITSGVISSARLPNGIQKRLTHGAKLVVLGDSISMGYGLASPATTMYGYLMSQDFGVTLYDRAISGDQACDLWPLQITPNVTTDQPVQATSNLYTLMIGTNDADVKGVGSYEAVFNTCQQAVLAWLAVPLENKVLPGNSAYVNTSGANSAASVTTNGVAQATMTATGVQTATIVTTGNPIYVWQFIKDGTAGSFTLSVDGGTAQGPFSTTTTPAIATQNGGTASVALAGRYPVAAGTHTVAFTWVSGTVGIVGVGSIPANPYYSAPTIAVGQVPNQGPTGAISTPATIAQYTSDVLVNAALIAGDGGDVRIAYDENYMLATAAEMSGGAAPLHPGPLGHVHLAQAFEATIQAVPSNTTKVVLPYTVTTSSTSGSSSTIGTIPTMNSSINGGYYSLLPTALGANGQINSISIGFNTSPNGTTPITVYIENNTTGNYYEMASSSSYFTVTPTTCTAPCTQTFVAGTAFTAPTVAATNYILVSETSGALVGYNSTTGSWAYNTGAPSTSAYGYSISTGTLALSVSVGPVASPPTTNVVTLPGMLPTGHCSLPNPVNSSALTNDTAPNAVYVSATGTDQITITNPAVGGMIFTGICTSY
jgi:lysophospholipase L1-like esterase